MGAGASSKASDVPTETVDYLKDTAMKPEDASDIQDLSAAKAEIVRLRALAKEHLQGGLADRALDGGGGKKNDKHKNRAAVRGERVPEVDLATYQKKVVEKDNAKKEFILNAIANNILFRGTAREDMDDIIMAFELVSASAGQTVIQQGDMGDNFYVLESGTLDIFVAQDGGNPIQVGSIQPGTSFGELALMYNQPRAATITAGPESQLWSLSRTDFRGITTYQKMQRMNDYMEFLRGVSIMGNTLGTKLDNAQLSKMALALEVEEFSANDVIIRQSESGEYFYIIESGEVSVMVAQGGGEATQVARLNRGQYFGERALLSEDTRAATCVATNKVKCLTLHGSDFVNMFGSWDSMGSGGNSPRAEDPGLSNPGSGHKHHVQMTFADLDVQRTLGCGAFGRVKLVKHKTDGNPYALKCQGKAAIVENNLQEHILNERDIMLDLDHPFILKLHNAFQDPKYIYFVLELLQGGELFTYLRNEGQFQETWARFYSATVLLGFSYMHQKRIAYRDLKPENLVLDAQGFLKIVDFGLAKVVAGGKTWTLCGTPDYLAPEIILSQGHDIAVDYWALGVLVFEMVGGSPPFYAEDPMEVYERILSGHFRVPSHFSKSLSDLIKKLLKSNQSKRLGNMKGGCNAIIKHKWYAGFDWEGLLNRAVAVPIVPVVGSADDVSNFDDYSDDEDDAPDCPSWTPEL